MLCLGFGCSGIRWTTAKKPIQPILQLLFGKYLPESLWKTLNTLWVRIAKTKSNMVKFSYSKEDKVCEWGNSRLMNTVWNALEVQNNVLLYIKEKWRFNIDHQWSWGVLLITVQHIIYINIYMILVILLNYVIFIFLFNLI